MLDIFQQRPWTSATTSATNTGREGTSVATTVTQSGTLVHVGRHLVDGIPDRLGTDADVLGIKPIKAIVANVTRILVRESCGRCCQFFI